MRNRVAEAGFTGMASRWYLSGCEFGKLTKHEGSARFIDGFRFPSDSDFGRTGYRRAEHRSAERCSGSDGSQ